MTFDLYENVMDHLLTKDYLCTKFKIKKTWNIVFTRFSQFDSCWTQMTFDLHQKQ